MSAQTRPIDESALDGFLRGFLACQRNPVLYPPEHPLCRRAIEKLHSVLDYFWDLENPFHLTAIEEDILVNGEISLFKQDDSLRRLEEIFQYHQIKKIVLFKGLSPEELLGFFNRLSFTQPPLLKELEQVRIGEGILLEKAPPETDRRTKDDYTPTTKGAFKLYDDALDAARKMADQIREEKILYPKEIKEMTWAMVEYFLKRKDIMVTMAQLKDYDDYTYTHSVNVSILTLAQAQSLNLPKKTLFEFALAGLTHDVGKEVIPLNILNKPGKLNDEEFRTIQNHALEGARILKKTPGMPFLCTIAAFEHQIKYDGSGYPKRRFSGESHLVSWLVTIADVFDALRSTRPYRAALSPEKIFSIMRAGEGTDFHPTLLNRFIQLVGVYHRGTFVILDDNAIAMVYKVNMLNPMRPLVKVICNPDGTLLPVPYLLNLMEHKPGSDRYNWSIQGIFESPYFQVNPLDYL
jgi:HD-GYP domain-containing protein (c-di-GMP phosphodiesterase class II)